MERFLDIIAKNPKSAAAEALAAIESAVQEFIGDMAPYDDLTLLIAKRT